MTIVQASLASRSAARCVSKVRDSLRVVGRYNRDLTPKYRQLVADAAASKRVHHLRSPRAMRAFVAQVEAEQSAR